MSQITARINLSARTFPLIARNWGRTVLVGQYDTNFNRQVQASTDSDHDVGIPQVYYMHNVMPHAQGFQSIAFQEVLAAGPVSGFDYVIELLDDKGNFALMGVTLTGGVYINDSAAPGWVFKFTAPTTLRIYSAYVSGVTYIYARDLGCKRYNFLTGVFDTVTLTGLPQETVGITSSFGYLIAWATFRPPFSYHFDTVLGSPNIVLNPVFVGPHVGTPLRVGDVIVCANFPAGTTVVTVTDINNYVLSAPATATTVNIAFTSSGESSAVYWSSTIDPTDFTPSLITGAGGGGVQDAEGPITFCIPHIQGFLIFTTKNVVAAAYSGNARYPFDFKAVAGSGGVVEPDHVTFQKSVPTHFAYTTSGLQSINLGSSTLILPDVTDFLSGSLFEGFDIPTKEFVYIELEEPMLKQVRVIGNRYLVLSYGVAVLSYALIYDIITTRMGKIKLGHVDCFELPPAFGGDLDIARKNIAFLLSDGSVQLIDFAPGVANPAAVLILGKYQFVRQRLLQLEEIVLENIFNKDDFELTVFTSIEGKYTDIKVVPYLEGVRETEFHYYNHTEGINHSLVCIGAFHIESGILTFTLGGKR